MLLKDNNNFSEYKEKMQDVPNKSSKAIIIALSAILFVVIILLVVFIMLYFSNKEKDSNSPSSSDSDTSVFESIATDDITDSKITTVVTTTVATTTATTTTTFIEATTEFKAYIIELTNPKVHIYDSPDFNGNIVGEITDKGNYTIVEEYYTEGTNSIAGTWGRLKSGVGWINLFEATDDTAETEPQPENNKPENSETDTTESTTEAVEKPDVVTETIHGVEFNYVPEHYQYFEAIDDFMEYDVDLTIKYCDPKEYITGNERPVSIYRKDGIYEKEEIGSVYLSAETDDFAIFEIKVNGVYENSTYSTATIEYRKYTSDGLILQNVMTKQTDYEIYAAKTYEETIDETFYIGFYTTETARVDFKLFAVGPNGFAEW